MTSLMSERSTTRLIVPLTSPNIDAMLASQASAAQAGADTVELRLDYLQVPPTADELRPLIADSPVDVIVTYRPTREGGKFDGPEADRLGLLARAAEFKPAFIDIEHDVPHQDWPDAPIILSRHDFTGVPNDLAEIMAAQDASPAAVNKIAFTPGGPEDAIKALDVVRTCTKPTMALAMGAAGVASRVLAGKVGAFGTFAALSSESGSAPGQPTIDEFRNLYRWDSIGPDTSVYGVIGCPVAHSMSPAIHNAAFGKTSMDAVYLPLRIEPGADNFNAFMDAAISAGWLSLRGLSVTLPHKENAMAYVGAANCDELAVKIGAVNTVTISPDGTLRGDNTDYAAAVDSLCNAMDIPREQLAGKATAVIGAGGVSRAIVAALRHYNAEVTIYNRTVSRAEKLADEFGCTFAGLDKADDSDAEIIINCTSIGMHPNIDTAPLQRINPPARAVFDTIYNPIETRLIAMAAAAGCLCVTGLDMFVNQAVGQFELWTRTGAPRETMRQVVSEQLQRR